MGNSLAVNARSKWVDDWGLPAVKKVETLVNDIYAQVHLRFVTFNRFI